MSADFNDTHYPRARKPHSCEECFRQIEAGEHYSRTAAVWCGDFFTNVACLHCAVARYVVDGLSDYYSEVFYGGLSDWLCDGWQESASAARIKVCVDRKWQRFDGSGLMSLSVIPVEAELERIRRQIGHVLPAAQRGEVAA